MDPPEGFDPNRGWYQHPTTGQWIPIQLPARAAVPPPEQTDNRQDAHPPTQNAQPAEAPIRRGPPPPRPIFRPSSAQAQPPAFPTPPSTQSSSQHTNTYSFQPPAPVSRTPLGPEFDSLFEPIPSPSPEPDPELEALAPPTTTQKRQKLDKGKKRAAAADETPAPAPKKAKAATTKAASKSVEKQPAQPPTSGSASHGGRQPGSQNYTDPDLKMLLRIVADVIPIGGTGWTRVADRFNRWAREHNRPIRTQKPLKTKFDQMARTPKPTGSAEIPPLIARAQEIDRQISGAVHLRDINDRRGDVDADEEEEEDVEEVEEEDSEVEEVEAPSSSKKKATKGPVLKTFRELGSSAPARQSSASRRAQVNDFMSAVTTSLDPAHRDARDEARFARRAAQDEISRLTQDNRDLRNRYDSLSERFQQQAFAHQQAMGEVTRLQARLDMLEMVGAVTGRHTPAPTPRSRYTASWDFDPASRPRRLLVLLLTANHIATAQWTQEASMEDGRSSGGSRRITGSILSTMTGIWALSFTSVVVVYAYCPSSSLSSYPHIFASFVVVYSIIIYSPIIVYSIVLVVYSVLVVSVYSIIIVHSFYVYEWTVRIFNTKWLRCACFRRFIILAPPFQCCPSGLGIYHYDIHSFSPSPPPWLIRFS